MPLPRLPSSVRVKRSSADRHRRNRQRQATEDQQTPVQQNVVNVDRVLPPSHTISPASSDAREPDGGALSSHKPQLGAIENLALQNNHFQPHPAPTYFIPMDHYSLEPHTQPISRRSSHMVAPHVQFPPPLALTETRTLAVPDQTDLPPHPVENNNNTADDPIFQAPKHSPSSSQESDEMHYDEVVDYLDVVDPEISTVTTLQNLGNSIFFPPIPMLYNRRPTFSLPTNTFTKDPSESYPLFPQPQAPSASDFDSEQSGADAPQPLVRQTTFTRLFSRKKAIPISEEEKRRHIPAWERMDESERNELDEHVRMLLTKKAKFKRAAKGIYRYMCTPMGAFITFYAVCVTFWGTAICLFLLRWINVHNPARQRYWIEICDQILCALFTMVGLGMAPFRAVDTYRMIYIARYHFLTYQRRKKLNLPELQNKNELPRSKPRLSMAQMTNAVLVKTGLKSHLSDPSVSDDSSRDSLPAATREAATDPETTTDAATEPRTADAARETTTDGAATTETAQVPTITLTTCRNTSPIPTSTPTSSSPSSPLDPNLPSKKNKKRPDSTHASASGPSVNLPNLDGILPLAQLIRNPSIASELPKDVEDIVVLSTSQQTNLEYQQRKFHSSHTFYRYRETITHRPFELSLMMTIVILLDCHSLLQACLGGTTWGIYYKRRPTSVTATIITFSLSCNAIAGLLIWYGGNRTKKKNEVERLLRIALEQQALKKMEKKRGVAAAATATTKVENTTTNPSPPPLPLECLQEE